MTWTKPVIAGNWKMNKGPQAARDFIAEFSTRFAPSDAAASSTSAPTSASTGSTERTTKGRPMKISATTTPSGVKATLRPIGSRYWPTQPLGA